MSTWIPITTHCRNADRSARLLTIIGATALAALLRFRVGIIATIAACGAVGLINRFRAG